MFILRADASGTEMLILLLYFNSSQFNWIYVLLLTGTQAAVQLNNVDLYGESLVLLVQRSNFQTPKRREAGADLFNCYYMKNY